MATIVPTLLNSKDIKSFVPNFSASIDDGILNDIIPIREPAVAIGNLDKSLAGSLYQTLIDDLVDYSGTASWNSATAYVVGNVVVFDGVYYTATQDNTNVEPSNVGFWTESPKFTTSCYENLYCNYLGRWLSLQVVKSALGTMRIQISERGHMQNNSANNNTLARAEYASYKAYIATIDQLADNAWQVMHAYIIKNKSTCDFSDYKYINCSADEFNGVKKTTPFSRPMIL